MPQKIPIAKGRLTRPQIPDSLGRAQTLYSGEDAFIKLGNGRKAIFFGLGPEPRFPERLAANMNEIHWLECPAFTAAMRLIDPYWPGALPLSWKRLEKTPEITNLDPEAFTVFFYRQNAKLFPEFWGPVLARAQMAVLGLAPAAQTTSTVFLPGGEKDLLHRELLFALRTQGFKPRELPAEPDPAKTAALVKEARPELFISVNMRGLNAEIFYFLQACGIPVAIWLVDNPWHILSQSRLSWWAEAHIFVTDPSFIPGLRAAGADKAHFLPLGLWPELWKASPPKRPEAANLAPMVFVGRSAFPGREKFFAAARVNHEALNAALNEQNNWPDFHWWMRKLGIVRPWPGNQARQAGFMAEKCSLAHKTAWLKEAAKLGLTIFGDGGWLEILKTPDYEPDLRPPIDYYGALPAVYSSARYVLNVTSLLLPSGLTQRHFDVWAAGGFLLSNINGGLDIFNRETVRFMAVPSPAALPELVETLEKDSTLRRDVLKAFKNCLEQNHTYLHRLGEIIKIIDN